MLSQRASAKRHVIPTDPRDPGDSRATLLCLVLRVLHARARQMREISAPQRLMANGVVNTTQMRGQLAHVVAQGLTRRIRLRTLASSHPLALERRRSSFWASVRAYQAKPSGPFPSLEA